MTLRLDIFADVICPWCLIGKAQLEQALAEAGQPVLDIHWQPYLLNPDMPAEGMDRRAYLEGKFGGRAEAAKAYTEIARAAEAAGIEMDLAAIRRTPNTLDAHRLIHWAGLEGRQAAVVDALFRSYFQSGEDIGTHAVLRRIAGDAGMNTELVARLLDTDADLAETRGRAAHARARGISGVPTFILAETHVLTGAQPAGFWRQVIAEITGTAPRGGSVH